MISDDWKVSGDVVNRTVEKEYLKRLQATEMKETKT
jgi:hypothetical protein